MRPSPAPSAVKRFAMSSCSTDSGGIPISDAQTFPAPAQRGSYSGPTICFSKAAGGTVLRCLLIGFVLAVGMSAARGASFQIVYNTPTDEDARSARAFIQEEGITQTVSTLLNEDFKLNRELFLYLGGGSLPIFDPSTNEIQMPYTFVFDVADRFDGDSYSDSDADVYDVARDAYLHALMHQVAHAMFEMFELQTTGSMEKAVDALTILMLISYYENGGDIVLNAAELFVDERGGSRERNFWDEHRLDQQSYNQALCLVYGSDPERYARLREGNNFLQIRGQECVREYKRQNNAWFRVLQPYMTRPPPS